MTLHVARGLLRCPHCAADLNADGARWVCAGGHSFDVAKQGYLNLAAGPEPANADTAAMLDARGRVLASGLFGLVSRALDEHVPLTGIGAVLEVGAGTGHYLAELVEARPPARGLALDVSRAAARRAARAHPRVASLVADVWRGLPVRIGAVDVVLCVFAPRNLPEFARVLRPDGRLLFVTPTSAHLAGLRARYGLLGIDDDKQARLRAAASDRFDLEHTRTYRLQATIPADLVDDVIRMGPNAFHDPPRPDAAEQIELSVELSVFRPVSITA